MTNEAPSHEREIVCADYVKNAPREPFRGRFSPTDLVLYSKEEQDAMGHDQLVKDFLHAFMREFLELFYPDVAGRLKFETLEFLGTELFTDFSEGAVREVDVVARLETHDGSPELILVHIEVQSKPEANFGVRMFQYYALLGHRFQLPVFPVVVHIRGGPDGRTEEVHRVSLFDQEQLVFRYHNVGLAHLDAREYLRDAHPVAAALAALMKRGSSEPATLRARMMREVAEGSLDEARRFLLVNFIETYFELSAQQSKRYEQLLSRKEFQTVQDVEMTWADRMKEEGRVEGKRDVLLRQLAAKFGPLPAETTAHLRALDSVEELDRLLGRLLTASTLEDLGI